MNNINITTEMCAEDRARIDRLAAAIEGLAAGLGSVGTPFATGVDLSPTADEPSYTNNRAPKDYKPAETAAEPADVPAAKPAPIEEPEVKEVPEHTQAELQQKVISLVSSGMKEEVKKIIEQYAPRVSAIPAEKINEVWDKLTVLEG